MNRAKSLLSLLPCALLLAVACDQGQAPDPEVLEDRVAEAAPPADELAPREHGRHARGHHGGGHHEGGGDKLMRLCDKLECTDDQRTRIEGLADRLAPNLRGERAKGDVDAANEALADAFAGDGLTAAALEAWRTTAWPEPGARADALAPAVVELHGILDPTQREALAEKIERHGLPFAGGRGNKWEGKRGGKRGHDRDDEALADRAAHEAAKVCGPLSCSEQQQEELAAVLQERPEPAEVSQDARAALADAFRGDGLSDAAVRAYLDAAAEARVQEHAAMDAQVVAIHELLTAEQRGLVAERIREDGPRGLGLHAGRDGGKKKHRRGGKKKHRRPHGDAERGGQQFG
ncbi:Spy/CpxP family protein refolding chaperone [Paraliomyxa miuraensis]|uniref:Spy/CpxP family protein refolding chaperone n=1 Tax=Paraliomyxa miuraensis TaxID=376150 RepID=UPI00224D9CBA|nr:Spy/CpxP family protein refolding chaperone [Paraliomyxa miuraensis]MCX4240032.1 Spy/CpxP family protein refolding chaperone [Paraliomyxa miuraensis]